MQNWLLVGLAYGSGPARLGRGAGGWLANRLPTGVMGVAR
jgi:hypothetical protein